MKRLGVLAVLLHASVLLFAGGSGEDFSLGLPIRGNGDFVTSEKPVSNFKCNDFSASISGYGDINGNIICKSFKANISGAGRLESE